MANQTHKSGGGSGMKVDIDITDYTEEITAGIKAAIKRALIRIGLEAEAYAKKAVHVVTGRLRNSITHYVKAAPRNSARSLRQDFCPNSRFGKRRNTVCISGFSN